MGFSKGKILKTNALIYLGHFILYLFIYLTIKPKPNQ